MADQQPSISAAFPAPPPFYKHFTEANIAQLANLRRDLDSAAGSETDRLNRLYMSTDVPSELRYLQPPPPPSNGKYRSFGEDRTLEAALGPLPWDTPALYSSPPKPANLLRLTRSILLNFLEYVHILATNPSLSEWGPKWDDLRDIFRNAHQAVNEYRPHQAREALILMMEAQLEKGRKEKERIRELTVRVEEMLTGLEEALFERTTGVNRDIENDIQTSSGEQERQDLNAKLDIEKRVWEVLTENFVS
ncbi:Mediator of RNA polymerase II transcription subunit 7 [Lambiella insularis]|nr:Mediator of RNA polymerase II transcription subunit 7 [Lambiella insularis]